MERRTIYKAQEITETHYKKVLLFNNRAVERYQALIRRESGNQADLQAEAKSNFKDATTSGDQGKMDASLSKLEAKRETIAQLDELLERFTMEWGDTDDRVIGSVAFAPPINLGQGQGKFTEDWALIELEKSKFDEENFVGNKMNLLAGDNTVENIRKAMAPDDTNLTTLF